MYKLPLVKKPSVNHASSELQVSLLPPIASLNYDVLAKIAKVIGGNISPQCRKLNGSFRQLLYFALTCRAFVDASLDELWRSMDSIVPLLKILPALQYKNNSYSMLMENVNMEDLRRMHTYSQRIKIFTLNEFSTPVLAQFAISYLMPFLPRVQQLNRTLTHPVPDIWSPVILSERLQHFRLDGYFSNTEGVKSILHALHFTTPALQHLDLIDPLTDDALNFIPTFIHLRSLGIHGIIDSHQFRQFATLPELLHLVVNFHASNPFPWFPLEDRIIAPKLQELDVTGRARTVASALAAMNGGALEAIKMTFHRDTEAFEISVDYCIAALIDRWPSTLRTLVIVCSKKFHFLSASQLQSFSRLARLAVLHISGFVLDNYRCKTLARSIPSITELEFEICDSSEPFQHFKILQSIAESCPLISKLQVFSWAPSRHHSAFYAFP